MTKEALAQADYLRDRIRQRQNLFNKHKAVIAQHMSELNSTDLATMTAAITGIHQPVITDLQNQLNALN